MEVNGVEFRMPSIVDGIRLKGIAGVGLTEIEDGQNAFYIYLAKILPYIGNLVEADWDAMLKDKEQRKTIEEIGSIIFSDLLEVDAEKKPE